MDSPDIKCGYFLVSVGVLYTLIQINKMIRFQHLNAELHIV